MLFFIHTIVPISCYLGAIHHGIHEGNIICLDPTPKHHKIHARPGASRDVLSQFGLVDFGDMTDSCCVFDLSTFLHMGTQYFETPPKLYVEQMKQLARKKNKKSVAFQNTDRFMKTDYNEKPQGIETDSSESRYASCCSLAHASRVKEGGSSELLLHTDMTVLLETPHAQDQPTYGDQPAVSHEPGERVPDASQEPDKIVLAGHAIAGYLTTSSLTELEWEVLLASVCARHATVLIFFRGNFPRNIEEVEKMASREWNGMKTLKRLLDLGKDRANAIWKGICEGYDIMCWRHLANFGGIFFIQLLTTTHQTLLIQ